MPAGVHKSIHLTQRGSVYWLCAVWCLIYYCPISVPIWASDLKRSALSHALLIFLNNKTFQIICLTYTQNVYTIHYMKFEWDGNKNSENIRKHRIDFNDVVEVFHGPIIVNLDDRFGYNEDRLIGIGFMKNMITIVVFIEKNTDVIRIISARKANKNETRRFKEEIKNRLG